MFRNIGKKIKGLANVLFWISAALWILTGFVVMIASAFSGLGVMSRLGLSGARILDVAVGIIAGVLVAALGFFLSWISMFLLYGFGELIDKTADNAKNTAEIKKLLEAQASAPAAPAAPAPAAPAKPAQPQPEAAANTPQ